MLRKKDWSSGDGSAESGKVCINALEADSGKASETS